jgi:hypothetical protein
LTGMVTARIAVLLIALFVFAALLVVDTGALLHLMVSLVMSRPAYRWAFILVPLAILGLYVWGRKGGHAPSRVRADRARLSRRPAPGARKGSRRPNPRLQSAARKGRQ